MSVIRLGWLGFGFLFVTLLLVIGTAYYHSQNVIFWLGNSVRVLVPAQRSIKEVDRLVAESGFAFLKFINRDTISARDVVNALDRLVAAEEDLIAAIPADQLTAASRKMPARKTRALLHAFLEEQSSEPAGDTTIQLSNAVHGAILETRQTLAGLNLSAGSFTQAIQKIEILANLLTTTEILFARYTARSVVSLTEAITPINVALKTLGSLPSAALTDLTRVYQENHPGVANPNIEATQTVLQRYRAALFAYDDAMQAGMTGTALIESLDAAQTALHQSKTILAQTNEDLTRYVHTLQEKSIAIGRQSQALFLSIAALGAIASLVIVYWVGTTMARRLGKLSEAAQQISGGELDLRIETSSDDALGKVAIAFNKMAARLRRREASLAVRIADLDKARRQLRGANEELEKRVANRTRALNEANIHLSAVNRELELAKDTAEKASRAKSQFLANMSHELRTPLNAIIGYAELLREEAVDRDDDVLIADLNKVRNAGKHLLGLISNVLDLSKVEAGKMEVNLQETELDDLLAEIEDTVRPLVAEKGNALEVTNTASLSAFLSDTQKLRQALLNLLGNAAKFTKDGAVRLHVSEEPAGWLNFSVSDTGVGMSADQLSKIVEPFAQADGEVSTKYGGTGLGLAITKSFAELLGGRLDVESAPGKGSRFTIRLPIQRVEDHRTLRQRSGS